MRAEFETRPNLERGFEPVAWKGVDEAIARAHRLRAEAFAEHAGRAARALRSWLRRLIGSAFRTRRHRADTDGLMRLDDRLLADIGLRRSDIKAAVYGDAPLRAARPEEAERLARNRALPAAQPEPGTSEQKFDQAA